MTKIDIFSGFLGAGKTTLIKKLIAEAFVGEKLVLIENEFGEIGIDGGFLKESGIEITEMNSGCICCSLVGDFEQSLRQVLEQFSPDRILIEPSGVGKLSDVIKAVGGVLSDTVKINSATAVVDAVKCKMYMKNFGEFFGNQIEHADCIVLSRTDVASEEKVKAATDLIRSKNQKATIITTPIDTLSGKDILNAIEKTDSLDTLTADLEQSEEICHCCGHKHGEHHHDHEHEHHHDHHHEHHHDHDDNCTCGCHDHHHEHHHNEHHHHEHGEHCNCGCHDHHADEVFTSFGKETTRRFTVKEIEDILSAFDDGEYGSILRAKGYLLGENEWIYFDYVPGEANVRFGAPAVIGRICVIGADIDDDALTKLFGLEA